MIEEDIRYHSEFLDSEIALKLFDLLKDNIKWTEVVKTTEGKELKLNRKMAYISDVQKSYFYANLVFETEHGTWAEDNAGIQSLLAVKNCVSLFLNKPFNSCLLNYYRSGRDEIKWHSDKEFCLGDKPVIPCVNLGASRTFWLQEKKENGSRYSYVLNNGDLLVMNENCQDNFLHAVLKEKHIEEPRISLTFRLCKD